MADVNLLIAELGLSMSGASEPEVFPAPPAPPLGEGRELPRIALTAALIFSPTPPPDVRALPIRPSGLEHSELSFHRIEGAPHLIQVSSAMPVAMRSTETAGVYRISEHAIGLELPLSGDVVVRAGSSGAHIVGDAQRVMIRSLATVSLNVPALALPQPPLQALMPILGSGWLARELSELVAVDDDWSLMSAAGLVLRFAEPMAAAVPPAPPRAVAVNELRAWMDSLAEPHRFALRELALSEVTMLEDDLAELAGNTDGGDPSASLVSDVAWWCRRRDDLESVRCLLGRHAEAVDAAIHELDVRAQPFVALLAASCMTTDERLYQAATQDPDAWWAEIAEAHQ